MCIRDRLNTVVFNGGCNATISNNNTGAPNACGGTTTVTFTATSDCESPKTCSATFTVSGSPTTLTCPVNQTEAACQTQAQIDTKFATWLASVSATGGCNTMFSNNNTGAPNACGGTTTVTFTPVSYTHLDVYKRQLQRLLQPRPGPAQPRMTRAALLSRAV